MNIILVAGLMAIICLNMQTARAQTNLTFVQDIWPIITKYIDGSNHLSATGANGNYLPMPNAATAYTNMFMVQSQISTSTYLITPYNHSASLLWNLVAKGPLSNGVVMPPGSTMLTSKEVEQIASWIDQGALFQIDAKGVSSVPGPNGGVIRGGNTVDALTSVYLSVVGTAAVIAITWIYLKIKL